ncbi:MAG: hypothetical protein V1875_08030 [Candidatus Altiarchaeota archaeon]
MKELLSDFAGLKAHLKECKMPFRGALIEYYRTLGEKQGFTALKDSSVIRNAYNFGRVDLVWVEPNVAFEMEFGLLDDIFRHMWKLMVLSPRMAVLLVSGNSKCSPQKVKELVSKTPQLSGIEFVVIDVSGGKIL